MKPVPARLVAAGTAVARAAAIAVPVLTSAQSPAATTITVQEKAQTVVQDDIAPKSKAHRVSVGDRLVTVQALFDASKKRIGTLYTDCASVGPTKPLPHLTLLCQTTYKLREGQIIASGVAKVDGPGGLTIVGGSGAYPGAHGTLGFAKPEKGFDTADMITTPAEHSS
jgi:hypothetical protein